MVALGVLFGSNKNLFSEDLKCVYVLILAVFEIL